MRRTISVKIRERGAERERLQRDFFELINSSFGNFKMIKLKGNEGELLSEFERASFGVARANISHSYLIEFPRIFLETLGFSIVVLIILYLILKYHRDITPDLPILSIFVLGLYRLLPSVNRIYRSFNHILFYLPSLEVVHNNLIYEPEELGDEPVQFQKQIEVRDLHFHFEEGKPILKGVNLQIKKGEKIGIVGESGSGKSTLLDLLVGLYKPVKGEILVDGVPISSKNVKSWRRKIGYIPQNIYLIDGTIAENVAFGEEIDPDRVRRALEMANLLEFLEKHHQGIETRVGENGVKLSGGQKQRVAIARALYNDPEILVLDEATSALDQETERKIMDEIYRVGENRTLIIVAHRLSTLDRCNRVVKLRNGKIVEEE
jgi:ATP-binding cassette subfamily B protein